MKRHYVSIVCLLVLALIVLGCDCNTSAEEVGGNSKARMCTSADRTVTLIPDCQNGVMCYVYDEGLGSSARAGISCVPFTELNLGVKGRNC